MPFAAHDLQIQRGTEIIARTYTTSMAKRIANALNAYTPDRRGI